MKKFFTTVMLALQIATASAQFEDGVFLLTEGMYGNSSGKLFYLPYETMEFGQTYGDINGIGFGETSVFATTHGDKIYVSSKQMGNYGGGTLVVADAATMQTVKNFSTPFSEDGHNYDGRAFLGITESKGYFGTSNGIFIVNLETYTVDGFIAGTDCGYGVGETINGGWYQWDVYGHQIGSMVRKGDYVFASQQNRGILMIDAHSDQIVNLISADLYGGSFGDLVIAKDGSIWTSLCTTENYSYEHHAELPYLVRIDSETLELELIEIENPITAPWSTWRANMLQACKQTNRLIWRQESYNDESFMTVGGTKICYYDIDSRQEGVITDIYDYNSTAFIYSGLSVDPETDLIYVPVATNGYYGPWKFLVFNQNGELILERNIPIGDWDDYPAMVFFTDDYAPEIELNDFEMAAETTLSLNLSEKVTDKDNQDAAIIVEAVSSDESILKVSISNNELTFTKSTQGEVNVTIKALSNGVITTKEIVITDDDSSTLNSVEVKDNAPVEYFNMQGIKVNTDNLGRGVYIKKQGTKTSKISIK